MLILKALTTCVNSTFAFRVTFCLKLKVHSLNLSFFFHLPDVINTPLSELHRQLQKKKKIFHQEFTYIFIHFNRQA